MSRRKLVLGKKAVIASVALLVAVVSVLALAMPSAAVRPNPGTIKVHDSATANPDERNEPKVTCDFWIEGFGMEGDSGNISFEKIPPPAGTVNVTPTGASLNWTADANGDFLKGPYQLADGHYKVTVNSIDDKDKSKVFTVDPCAPPTTTTEVPFFPSATALALGTVGALGGAFLLLRRRN